MIPAIVLFGSATAVFGYLALKWSKQLAVDSLYSPHTDGLRLSASLAWIAAFLLLVGTVAAVVGLVRGLRNSAAPPAK